jgi:hypothetical protein
MPNENSNIEIMDENDISYDDGYDSASPKKRGASASSASRGAGAASPDARPSTAPAGTLALAKLGATLPGVRIPDAALHPRKGVAASPSTKNSRNRETLIINRTDKGKAALKPIAYPCARPKDFSSYYPVAEPTYHKDYLNELCYNDSQREHRIERRKKEIEREVS